MAEPITIQKLLDASIDTDSLEVAVNGDENTNVDTRLGGTYPTLAKAIKIILEQGTLNATLFKTKAIMTASSLLDNTYALVTDDTTIANNGYYQKQSGAWVFSGYNPTAQSRAYVDSTLAPLNKISINSGKNYPLKSLPRNNTTSVPRADLNNALLDVKIYGALPDHYYRIAYIKNGLTSLGDYPYGVQIDEMPIAGYEDSSVTTSRIIDYTDPAPNIPRGGVHTQVIKSPRQPDFEVHLTFDTDKLPPVGSFINLKDAGNAAWSWVIDPSNYTYAKQRAGVYYKVDNDLNVSFEYQSGLYYYRVTFGKNGFNNLPNIRKIERSVANRSKVWSTISETDTDYLPPLVFKVLNNGDVGATSIYTGGNHGTSGAAGGNQTARNVYYRIAANGQELSAGSSGYAESVDLFIINELMAYNTVSTGRYAIRQTFKVELKKAQVIVNADIHALEDIEIATDNGLQLYTGGYQGTQIIVGGQDTTRVAFKDKTNSGLKTNAPNAFALVLQNQFDQLAMWMDREYGAGDTRYIPNSATLIRAGTGTSTKWYNAIIANTAQQITASSGYKWRGGYSIERKANITGYDSAFSKDDGFVSVVDASNFTIID